MENVSFFWVIPFALILLSIALFPLLAPHFWESNLNKAFVSLGLALPVGVLLVMTDVHLLLHTLHEYASFLILLAALYIVSGGIRLFGDLKATPTINTSFLALGAVLANFIGTTGASMLLIRPLLETNKERKHTSHIPLFFIFIVSNIGGMLTPLGDPPLFLGFLRGVPFLWTLHLWQPWLVSNLILLGLFFWMDTRAHKKESQLDRQRDETQIQPLKLSGKRNLVLLVCVMASAFLPTPYREGAMIALSLISLVKSPEGVRRANQFSLHPINEVAVLFAGIFIAMVPALELLHTHGAQFGITKAWQFYWLTGGLSAFLDNAPTYLTFFSLAQSLPPVEPLVAGVSHHLLLAISSGAVMMGAITYIGNGPNFMVKALAEKSGVKMPSFFGYMRYSIGILVPIFLLITFLFYR